MSGKHVHWEDSSFGTPSPTWSDASLPSTSGPITPPAPHIELPDSDCELHPILRSSRHFQIDYDVSLPASTASIRDPKLSQYALAQPATTPPLPYLEIIIPHLPWKLVIWPAVRGSPVVTVSDVLVGIYANLRLPVTVQEFEEGGSDIIAAAFRRRCRRGASKETEAAQIAKGVKRIDFLEGNNTFRGLTPTKQIHIFRMDTSD